MLCCQPGNALLTPGRAPTGLCAGGPCPSPGSQDFPAQRTRKDPAVALSPALSLPDAHSPTSPKMENGDHV